MQAQNVNFLRIVTGPVSLLHNFSDKKFSVQMSLKNLKENFCITMEDVYNAKVKLRGQSHVTALSRISSLNRIANCKLYFKMETMQRCRTFKFRGAYNKVSSIPEGKTVAAVSDGNHSQGIALAASMLNVPNVIYLPKTAINSKVEATINYGGNVVFAGKDYSEAEAQLRSDIKDHPEWVLALPFNDPLIIAGNSTIGIEIIEQLPEVETVVVPVGGGGLISGIAYAIKHIKPSVRIIGVQVASCPSTYKLFQSSKGREVKGVSKEAQTPLADGIDIKAPGDLCLPIILKYVDEMVLVNEDEIAMAVSLLADRAKTITEGSAAATFAAVYYKKFFFRADEVVTCVLSGGNIPLRMLNRCIDRALFLRGERYSVSVVVPYGTNYFSKLLTLFSEKGAEVVSCDASPHIDTSANREQYRAIIDVTSPSVIDEIKEACEEKEWYFSSNSVKTME